jgi:hypothetical protein
LCHQYRRCLRDTAQRHTVFKNQHILGKCYSSLKVYLEQPENSNEHGQFSHHVKLQKFIDKFLEDQNKAAEKRKKQANDKLLS